VKLLQVLSSPEDALLYMESHVNDGSPSGFTYEHQPSRRYAPGSCPGPFVLWACATEETGRVRHFGEFPSLPGPTSYAPSNWIYIHPDMSGSDDLDCGWLDTHVTEEPLVLPTSSGRTVQIVDRNPRWYIKLHYGRLLGRIDRSLPWDKAVAGVEVSQEMDDAISNDRLPRPFHILRETGARSIQVADGSTWAMVAREPIACGPRASDVHALVPWFALFSKDSNSTDGPLLDDLLHSWSCDATKNLKEGLLEPVVDSYFALVSNLGLQVEMNAQNLLLALDRQGQPVGIVLRDLMGVEKDIPLRSGLGLTTSFRSGPYKTIGTSDGDLYAIRHSFAFDFKLGEYILRPVIECAARSNVGDAADLNLTAHVRERVQQHLRLLPGDYLPRHRWYRHPRVLLNRERPYEMMERPRYR